MKPFLVLCGGAVIAAVVAPFFLKIDGVPLMTTDELIDDHTPAALKTPTRVYRWQDADGSWHFGSEPPPDAHGARVESIEIEERITTLERGWQGRSAKPSTAPKAPEIPGIAGYVSGGKAVMDDAVREVEKLNQRTEQLEAMRQSLP